MKGKIFTQSLSWVIAAFLFVLAFFRDPGHQWLFVAVFGIWAAYLVVRLLLSRIKSLIAKVKTSVAERKKKRNGKKKQPTPKRQEQPVIAVEGNELERLLLGHVSCRISEKLKSAYPEATWQWCDPNPDAIIHGETGRIRTFNTEDFTHAEVSIGEYYRISFKMMKIVDFAAAVSSEAKDEEERDVTSESEPQVVDPTVWYELVGREVLTNLINDLSTRGHSGLYITEDGTVCFTEGAQAIKAEELKEFPSKQYWPDLAKCFEKDDLKAQLLDNRISVAWG